MSNSAILLHQLSNALGQVTTDLTGRSSRMRPVADFPKYSATDDTLSIEIKYDEEEGKKIHTNSKLQSFSSDKIRKNFSILAFSKLRLT